MVVVLERATLLKIILHPGRSATGPLRVRKGVGL